MIWTKENLYITFLLVSSVILIYFLPSLVAKTVFLAFIFFAYKSNNNAFWIVFIFILLSQPGGFFSGGLIVDQLRVPIYTIAPGVSFQFEELFIMMLIVKAIKQKKKANTYIVLKNQFRYYFYYLVFLVIFSLIIGMNFFSIKMTLRYITPWILIYYLPYLLNTDKHQESIARLLFPFTFSTLFFQLYLMRNGVGIVHLVKKNYLIAEMSHKFDLSSNVASRAIDSPFVLLVCTFLALYYLKKSRPVFPKIYLIIIVTISFLSIVLSATRGWILAFSFLIILGFFFTNQGKRKTINTIVSIVLVSVVFNLFLFISPMFKNQVERSFSRLATLEELYEGDLTAGGTLRRLSVRGPIVMEKFWESPIIGWGFSDVFFEYTDGHVGNQSMLLNLGILGYILFVFILIMLIKNILLANRITKQQKNKISLNIYLAYILSFFIIHSTSTQLFGFSVPLISPLTFIMIFSFLSRELNSVYASRMSNGIINKKMWQSS